VQCSDFIQTQERSICTVVICEYTERDVMRSLCTSFNRIAPNGVWLNSWSNGLSVNGFIAKGWNVLFIPDRFSEVEHGSNWIDANLLGPKGVGHLDKGPSIQKNILDNRNIRDALKTRLCLEDSGELTFQE
jgi:hypothetical protein